MVLHIVKKRQLIKYGTLIMKCVRIKYCFVILTLFMIYQLFNSTDFFERYLQSMTKRKTTVHLRYLVVHVDLKGMPPKLTYLSDLVVSLKKYGVNAILMEYEDMFPYEGRLVNLSARNCYKKDQLKHFLHVAHKSGLEVIPLVQTFGHMEYVLKLKEFMHLREKVIHPSSICPSKNESIELIKAMLEQVINFHNSVVPLNHIHIGCDEVYNMNDCRQCRRRKMENIMLFLKHVETVDNIIKKLTPHTTVLIWNDMLYKKNSALHAININLSNVEPVYWDYSAKFNVSHKNLYEQHKVFNNIWVASAFKGAEADDAVLPNLTTRFSNNRRWLTHIADYQFGGENKAYHFKGMILTGWSRRTHMAPPFELLISSIPSLILNLMLIKAAMEGICLADLRYMNKCDLFEKYVSTDFYNTFVPDIFSSLDNTTECSFEGIKFHTKVNKLFDLYPINKLNRVKFLEYNFEIRNIDMFDVEYGLKTCKMFINKLLKQSVRIKTYMAPYYEEDTINEYISYKIGIHVAKLRNIISILQNYSTIRYWERRPNILIRNYVIKTTKKKKIKDKP